MDGLDCELKSKKKGGGGGGGGLTRRGYRRLGSKCRRRPGD